MEHVALRLSFGLGRQPKTLAGGASSCCASPRTPSSSAGEMASTSSGEVLSLSTLEDFFPLEASDTLLVCFDIERILKDLRSDWVERLEENLLPALRNIRLAL